MSFTMSKGFLSSGTIQANLLGLAGSIGLYLQMIKPEVAAIVGGVTGLLAIWRRIKAQKKIVGVL